MGSLDSVFTGDEGAIHGQIQFTCGNKVTQGSKGYPCDLMIWARWRSGLRQGTLAIL